MNFNYFFRIKLRIYKKNSRYWKSINNMNINDKKKKYKTYSLYKSKAKK